MGTLKEKAAKLDLTDTEKESETGKGQESNPSRVNPPAKMQAGAIMPDLDQRAEEIIRAGFEATDQRWSQGAKDWVSVVDYKTRLEYLRTYLAYKHGMPVQRQIKIEASFKDNEEQLLALIQTSPEARRELIKAGVISEEWIEKKAKKVS